MEVRLVFSTDASGFAQPATVIASVLRRTCAPVSVRIYTRGIGAESFRCGRLEVDFVRCEEQVAGEWPKHVSAAAFDRLRIIRDEKNWDRVLVMDHDMLAFCDLAEYFGEPFDGNLLIGRLFDWENSLRYQMRDSGGLPEAWMHAADHPFFYMGPMMNLEAMRQEGVWDRLLEAHAAIGKDEQVALAAVCGGRIRGIGTKWNMVPKWDGFPMVRGEEHPDHGVPWRNGVPEGLIHWTGRIKPWFRQAPVWRADLWESEACDWEQLRTGTWDKPLAVEIKPDTLTRAKALLRRGWRVRVSGIRNKEEVFYPDFEYADDEGEEGWPEGAELLRFGPETLPGPSECLSNFITLEGPRTRDEMAAMRAKGFLGEARIQRNRWAPGGPHPKVLSYCDPGGAFALPHEEDCYLSRLEEDHKPGPPVDESDPWGSEEDGDGPNIPGLLAELLTARMVESGSFLVLSPDRFLRDLAERLPQARLIGVEHHIGRWRQARHALRDLENVEILHAPLDPILLWYDLSGIDLPELDCVIVGEPRGNSAAAMRDGALSLMRLMKPGALVALCGPNKAGGPACNDAWTEAGFETLQEDDTVRLLSMTGSHGRKRTKTGCGLMGTSGRLADAAYVMTTPDRPELLEGLRSNWERLGGNYEVLSTVLVPPPDIRWEEMKGLDAVRQLEKLHDDYVMETIGMKRAMIAALERFLGSRADSALICRDTCRWKPQAARFVEDAVRQLPDDWDLLYFSTPSDSIHLPFDTRLTRIRGARQYTAVLWPRETALELLPELKACDCEFDVFLERAHSRLNAFCAVPMPAYQASFRRRRIPSNEPPPKP